MLPPQRTRAPDLFCFSHLRWNFVFQRPQHLLTRASESYRVHYFEEPRFEAGGVARFDISKSTDGVLVVTPVLPDDAGAEANAAIVRGLLNRYIDSLDEPPAVAWYYTPMALLYSGHLQFPVTVYDCMDELANFKGAPNGLVALEKKLFARSDLVFTGGHSLYEAKRKHHPRVHAFPSSVDTAHFLPARDGLVEPTDMMPIGRPRVGFFGVIDERFDLALLDAVAMQRPDWRFVMIGPVVKIDTASLPIRPNIHWMGSKTYAELPRYLSVIDVGWMPFARNDSTRFISPTKTPEFLAAGLPVVSTPITDVVRSWGESNLVQIAGTPGQSVAAIERCLRRSQRAEWLERVDRQLATGSWDSTWRAMKDLVVQAGGGGVQRSGLSAKPTGQVVRV